MHRKPGACLILTALIISLLLGCKSGDAKTPPTPSDDGFAKLSGYPYDLLPLYECQKVTYGLYEVTYQDADPFFGRSFYEVRYLTFAEKQDVLNHYADLIAEEDDTVFEDSVFGRLESGHMAEASVNTLADGSLEVSLTLGMEVQTEEAESQPTEGFAASASPSPDQALSNPYFDGFSMSIAAPGAGRSTLYSMSYERTNDNERSERRFVTYTTDLAQQEFTDLCQKAYANKKDFAVFDTDYSLTFSFEDAGVRCAVYLTKPQNEGDPQFLTLVFEQ